MRTLEPIDLQTVCGAAGDSPACAAAVGAANSYWGETGNGTAYATGFGMLAGLAGGTAKSIRMKPPLANIGSVGTPIVVGSVAGAVIGHYAVPPLARFATKHFSSACRG